MFHKHIALYELFHTPGFVGGMSTSCMVSLLYLFSIASSRDCLVSIVFMGAGVFSIKSSIASSSFLFQLPLPWSDIYHLHNLLSIQKVEISYHAQWIQTV